MLSDTENDNIRNSDRKKILSCKYSLACCIESIIFSKL